MTNAILANDTSGTSNPGCQGTVACLMDLLQAEGISVLSRLPVGYRYHDFAKTSLPAPQADLPTRIVRRIRRSSSPLCKSVVRQSSVNGSQAVGAKSRPLCPQRWNEAVDRLLPRLDHAWHDASQLIVNGEGTIHHDSIGARSLIGLCSAGKKLGKRVSLVNCSIYALSQTLLDAIRDSVDRIVVREPVSWRYLQQHGITATLAADCLFHAAAQPLSQSVVIPGWLADLYADANRVAIYTPGVLSGTDSIPEAAVAEDVKRLISEGYRVLYYVVEAEDERLLAAACSAGASAVPLGSLQWQEVFAFLRSVNLVVSGRYHINIFSAIAGVPFVPMQTNTGKMDGLLELLEVPSVCIRSAADVNERCLSSSPPVLIKKNRMEQLARAAKHSAHCLSPKNLVLDRQ